MAHLSLAGMLRSTVATFVNLLVGVALVGVSAVLLATHGLTGGPPAEGPVPSSGARR
ncbi:hypothetical protein [Actinomadura sp. KC345]|uniref:hypothetical protein n=1 Tax=Actinomadura sp. KC345 TaxID=2530371 RepID=UPI0014049FEE|nr:hypothetical protein [Actinomadura sp. KC345]